MENETKRFMIRYKKERDIKFEIKRLLVSLLIIFAPLLEDETLVSCVVASVDRCWDDTETLWSDELEESEWVDSTKEVDRSDVFPAATIESFWADADAADFGGAGACFLLFCFGLLEPVALKLDLQLTVIWGFYIYIH